MIEELCGDVKVIRKETYMPPPHLCEMSDVFPYRTDTFYLESLSHGIDIVRIISGMPGGKTVSYLGRSEGNGLMAEVQVNGSVRKALVGMAMAYR